jgi:beta-phosphoglucomutase
MDWISKHQFYLFDFDGLLVDTENYHYLAYKKMLASHGIELTWDFSEYCLAAHYTPERFHKTLLEEFPQIKKYPWEELYHEKQQIIQALLHEKTPDLMEGAEKLLTKLQKGSIPHCVVTNSTDALVTVIRQKHSVLDKIPYWITRHDYTHPKPNPECYQLAIARYSKPQNKVVGFEDTPRGLAALMATDARCILVTKIPYIEIPQLISQGVSHFPSLLEVDI